MVKSVSVVLGYLFITSSVYYIMYFGDLGIDIFQYISVSDIVKGVIYPLRAAEEIFIFFIIALIMAFILNFEQNKKNDVKNKIEQKGKNIRTISIVTVLTACILGSITYFIIKVNEFDNGNTWAIASSIVSATSFVSIYGVYDFAHRFENSENKKAKIKNYPLAIFIDYFTVGAAAYFFSCAIAFGKLDANNVISHRDYNYATNLILPAKNNIVIDAKRLVYFGTISGMHLFSDSNNVGRSYLVISKDSFPVLYIHHYKRLIPAKGIMLQTSGVRVSYILLTIICFTILLTTIVFFYRRKLICIVFKDKSSSIFIVRLAKYEQ